MAPARLSRQIGEQQMTDPWNEIPNTPQKPQFVDPWGPHTLVACNEDGVIFRRYASKEEASEAAHKWSADNGYDPRWNIIPGSPPLMNSLTTS